MRRRTKRRIVVALATLLPILGVLAIAAKILTMPGGQEAAGTLSAEDSSDARTLRDLKLRLREQPDNLDLRWRYAKLLLAMGDATAASTHVEQLFLARPTLDLAMTRLEILNLQGEFRQAIELAGELEAQYSHPRLYLQRGIAQSHLGSNAEARADLERVLQIRPTNWQAKLELARLAVRAQDYRRSDELLAQIPEATPAFAEALLLRAKSELYRMRLDEALARYNQVLELEPESRGAITGLAQIAVTEQGAEAAADYLARLDPAQDRSRSLVYLRGVVALELGDLEAAKQHFQNVLRRFGDHFYSLRHLAEVHYRLGRWSQAKRYLDRAATREPGDRTLLLLTARICRALREFDCALEALETLYAAEAQSEEQAFERALTYQAMGRLDDADASFRAALALDPDDRRSLVAYGQLLLDRGEFESAFTVAHRLRNSRLAQAEGHSLQGRILLADGDAVNAADQFRKALALTPSIARTIDLALAQRALGDLAGAEQLLEDWRASHPGDPTTFLALAAYARQTGDRQAAIDANRRVLMLKGDDLTALKNLIDLLEDDDPTAAAEYARRALDMIPNEPAMQAHYGWLLVQKGEVHRGLQALNRAMSMAPPGRLLRYRRGVALARTDSGRQARQAFEALISENGEDQVARQALAWLERLKTAQP